MNADEVRSLEIRSVIAPLGLRFRDAVTGGIVRDGISVTAYPSDNPSRTVEGFSNRKGVYLFRGLPGMREVEFPSDAGNPLVSMAGRWTFIVEIADVLGRYLPARLVVNAPVKGVYRWSNPAARALPFSDSSVPLYSTPSRPVPAAMAVVRAQLLDSSAAKPAAWAIVDAMYEGKVIGRGMSDDRGEAVIIFPYPEPKDSASPPHQNSPRKLADRSWSLQLRAFYSRLSTGPAAPALDDILEQAQGTLLRRVSPHEHLGAQTLKFGSELVVASQSRSELLITPSS